MKHGILCPTQAEFRATLGQLEVKEEAPPGPFPAVASSREGKDYVVCRSGIGKAAAAAATQWLVDRHGISSLIVCGVAGSLVPDLKVGDVVIAEELIPADCGFWNADGFCFTGAIAEEDTGFSLTASYSADRDMLAVARDVAGEGIAGADAHRVVRGSIVTCDQATFAMDRRRELADTFSAFAVEMEGAAAALVAGLNDLPCLVIRAISDEISFDLPGVTADTFSSSHPDISKLRESISLAAERAARIAVAVLGRLP